MGKGGGGGMVGASLEAEAEDTKAGVVMKMVEDWAVATVLVRGTGSYRNNTLWAGQAACRVTLYVL